METIEDIDALIIALQAKQEACVARARSEAATAAKPATPRVEIVFSHNYGFIDKEKTLHEVKDFVVFSGECFNWGEDISSRIADAHAKTLESVVYCPHITKGGIFIRPKYHAGNRAGTQEFPQLTYICMNFDHHNGETKLPVEYGWCTPVLKVMAFRMDAADVASEDTLKTLAIKCYKTYPTLERVDFIVYPTDGSMVYTRLDQVVPIKTVSADILLK